MYTRPSSRGGCQWVARCYPSQPSSTSGSSLLGLSCHTQPYGLCREAAVEVRGGSRERLEGWLSISPTLGVGDSEIRQPSGVVNIMTWGHSRGTRRLLLVVSCVQNAEPPCML
eukprot:1186997-Prorocentrum_minimum.AAC.7